MGTTATTVTPAVQTEDSLFKVYPNKNIEVRMLASKAFEFGRQSGLEPSAGSELGVDTFAVARQQRYCDVFTQLLDSIHARPLPDLPGTFPTRYDVDLTDKYVTETKDGIPINEDTELLMAYWLNLAVSIVNSQSAAQAGSLLDADYIRATAQVAVIVKFLVEIAKRPIPDVPSTALPGAVPTVPVSPVAN